MKDTRPLLMQSDFPAIRRRGISTLQVNLGYKCNLSCVHCHVNAGPHRSEMMPDSILEAVIAALARLDVQHLDLTGGAPELHPGFRRLVKAGRARGVEVIDRCNLTILFEPGQETLAEFLAEQGVTIIASMPCYLEENLERQRGTGVHGKSIRAIRLLNSLGYGEQPELRLDLVFNPIGPVLPPNQAALEADYKKVLGERYGISFNQLLTLTNMPINRFGAVLLAQGEFARYMQLLRDSFRAENLAGVMCRDSISVDWQGNLHDCDFNQMLGLPLGADGNSLTIADIDGDNMSAFSDIRTADHCYGCTAGQGSSCGGALS